MGTVRAGPTGRGRRGAGAAPVEEMLAGRRADLAVPMRRAGRFGVPVRWTRTGHRAVVRRAVCGRAGRRGAPHAGRGLVRGERLREAAESGEWSGRPGDPTRSARDEATRSRRAARPERVPGGRPSGGATAPDRVGRSSKGSSTSSRPDGRGDGRATAPPTGPDVGGHSHLEQSRTTDGRLHIDPGRAGGEQADVGSNRPVLEGTGARAGGSFERGRIRGWSWARRRGGCR